VSTRPRRSPRLIVLALLALAIALGAPAAASAGPVATKQVFAVGKIVPIPASVPHEAGDMVDRRIVPDLVWLAKHYPIYVTDGYSGPLPNGQHVGCDECHARNSDHYNGLAVDLVPLGGGTKCDASWAAITTLAEWAEPIQNEPVPPFRWVGYNGDAGHGCGNHLHLSWNHSPVAMFQLAEWVEVFPVGPGESETAPRTPRAPRAPAPPAPPSGPSGGISRAQTGGVGVHHEPTGPPPGVGD